ncbi:MAG: TolC family protein [Planctomycetota bacterium]
MSRSQASIASLAIFLSGSFCIAGCRSVPGHPTRSSQVVSAEKPDSTADRDPPTTVGMETAVAKRNAPDEGNFETASDEVTAGLGGLERPDSISHYLRPASFPLHRQAPATAPGLTLSELEAIALQWHPAIRQQQARVEVARGRRVQVGLPFNPILQYQSEEVGNEQSSGLHSVAISQQFVTADKLSIAQQVECREVQKQQARLRFEELRVLGRVRLAFNRAFIAQQRQRLTDQILQVAEESVAAVDDLVRVEEASRLALLQTTVQAEQARIDSENAGTNYQASMRRLAAAVSEPSIAAQTLAGDLASPLQERPWDGLVHELIASSPEMSLAGSELQRARWALQLASAQVIPNVTGQAGVGYDAATDDTFATLGVSVPLPIRNRNQGAIWSARAGITAASNAMDQTRLSLERRLADAVGRYEVARERHVRLTESVVPAAQEAYDLASLAFAEGEVDYLQLLTAQRALFNTQISVLDAWGSATAAAAEIDTSLISLPF